MGQLGSKSRSCGVRRRRGGFAGTTLAVCWSHRRNIWTSTPVWNLIWARASRPCRRRLLSSREQPIRSYSRTSQISPDFRMRPFACSARVGHMVAINAADGLALTSSLTSWNTASSTQERSSNETRPRRGSEPASGQAPRNCRSVLDPWTDLGGCGKLGVLSREDIDSYLAALEEPKRTTLEALRQSILGVVPDAEQSISYGMPTFKVDGKVVAGFAAFKGHLSYLPHQRFSTPHPQQRQRP